MRKLSLTFFISLALLLAGWTFLHPVANVSPWLILVFELLALALVAPGVLLGSPRGYSWACFVINLYFIKGVLAWIDPARTNLGIAETLCSVGFFISGLLYTRWFYQLERRKQQDAATQEEPATQ